jgi:hypothetical protein
MAGVVNSNRQAFPWPGNQLSGQPDSSKEEAQNGFFAGLTLAAIEFNCEKADYFRRYWRS